MLRRVQPPYRWKAIATRVALGILCGIALSVGVGVGALLLYALFYHLYVPVTERTFPVYLNYELPQPAGLIDLTMGGADTHWLHRSQPYDVFVRLALPDTPANRQIGMFMLKVAFVSDQRAAETLLCDIGSRGSDSFAGLFVSNAANGAVALGRDQHAVYSVRPARVPFTSWPLRWLRTALLLGPLLAGLSEEVLHIRVPVLSAFVDNATHPVRLAVVLVSDVRLEVVGAYLDIVADLRGLSYIMYHWFYASSMLGVLATATLLSISTGCVGVASIFLYHRYNRRLGAVPPPPARLAMTTPTAIAEPLAVNHDRILAEAIRNDPLLVYDPQLRLYNFPPVPVEAPVEQIAGVVENVTRADFAVTPNSAGLRYFRRAAEEPAS